jgi:hypothetical protein
MKAMNQKKEENQMNMKIKEAEQQIESVKKTTQQQIDQRRKTFIEDFKKKVQEDHMKADQYKQELKIVKIEMAHELKKAYKKGTSENCKLAMQSENNRKNYCIANFAEIEDKDFGLMNQCTGGDEFCNFCCNNEFGEMNAGDRITCKDTACKTAQVPTATPNQFAGLIAGSWAWMPGSEKKP